MSWRAVTPAVAAAVLLSANVDGARQLGLPATPGSSCVVVYEAATGRTTRSDDKACATRLPPASTFKIPHALLALESGVVTATSIERWDGTRHPGRPKWDQDLTVPNAIRPSAVWVFQKIAPRVGAARMHDWLASVHYGNADTSGPVTEYWLNGHLRVSPDEQVTFLRRFYADDLPLRAEHLRTIQAALIQDAGTVENATGLHPLPVAWRNGLILSAKTGATRADDGTNVAWLVGQLTVDAKNYVFASAAWAMDVPVDQLAGMTAAMDAFVARGLLRYAAGAFRPSAPPPPARPAPWRSARRGSGRSR